MFGFSRKSTDTPNLKGRTIHFDANHAMKVMILRSCDGNCRQLGRHMSPESIIRELGMGAMKGWDIINQNSYVIGW